MRGLNRRDLVAGAVIVFLLGLLGGQQMHFGRLLTRAAAQIAAAGLSDKVLMLGPRPRPEVLRLVAEADVMALTSAQTRRGNREGIPVALMEGMACGLPVVASGISGIPELVDDGLTGILTPPRDPVAVADALQKLAGDPELRVRMGMRGREKVCGEFDLHANAARLIELFLSHGAESDATLRMAPSRAAQRTA